jgi:hypothetical protein
VIIHDEHGRPLPAVVVAPPPAPRLSSIARVRASIVHRIGPSMPDEIYVPGRIGSIDVTELMPE